MSLAGCILCLGLLLSGYLVGIGWVRVGLGLTAICTVVFSIAWNDFSGMVKVRGFRFDSQMSAHQLMTGLVVSNVSPDARVFMADPELVPVGGIFTAVVDQQPALVFERLESPSGNDQD